MLQPELKRLHSPDVFDLEGYRPDSQAFGFLVQAMVGPKGSPGEEAFSFLLCTPEWIREHYGAEVLLGLHHLIVPSYDYVKIVSFVSKFVSGCSGSTWIEVAQKLTRLGSWEFDGYGPAN